MIIDHSEHGGVPPLSGRCEHFQRSLVCIPVPQGVRVFGLIATHLPRRQARLGALVPPVTTAELPASLLTRFAGAIEQQLLSLLRFLVPITTGVGLMRAI